MRHEQRPRMHMGIDQVLQNMRQVGKYPWEEIKQQEALQRQKVFRESIRLVEQFGKIDAIPEHFKAASLLRNIDLCYATPLMTVETPNAHFKSRVIRPIEDRNGFKSQMGFTIVSSQDLVDGDCPELPFYLIDDTEIATVSSLYNDLTSLQIVNQVQESLRIHEHLLLGSGYKPRMVQKTA